MLKEYVAVSSASSQTPVEFVASFWDQRWRDLRDNRRLLRLRQREEYRFLKKVVRDFSNRPLDILDCGCGQGNGHCCFSSKGIGPLVSISRVRPFDNSAPSMARPFDSVIFATLKAPITPMTSSLIGVVSSILRKGLLRPFWRQSGSCALEACL